MDNVITDIETASPVVDQINKLTSERSELLVLWNEAAGVNNKEHQRIQTRLEAIRSEIISLRGKIEYTKLKMFIYVSKRYLTRELYKTIWAEVEQVLNIIDID